MVEARPGELALHAHEPRDLLGAVLSNRYRILRLLGSGGMGTVYLAEHVELAEQIAVKVLNPRFAFDPEWVQRFRLEAKAALRIRHPNVVRVLDFSVPAAGFVYMVMELISGETLADLLHREGPLPWERVLCIADQIASALDAAHAQGIVHRDIKPANCVRTTVNGNDDFIKVLDFGIAKFMDPVQDGTGAPRTSTGMWMGTAEYMAPEMFRGEQPGARVDVYALGILMYRLVSGQAPFRGTQMDVAMQLSLRDAAPPSRSAPLGVLIPPEVDALILRAIAREIGARTPSMAALRAEISAARRGGPKYDHMTEDVTIVVRRAQIVAKQASQSESVTTTTTVRGHKPVQGERAVLPTEPVTVPARPTQRTLKRLGGAALLGVAAFLGWHAYPRDEPLPGVAANETVQEAATAAPAAVPATDSEALSVAPANRQSELATPPSSMAKDPTVLIDAPVEASKSESAATAAPKAKKPPRKLPRPKVVDPWKDHTKSPRKTGAK